MGYLLLYFHNVLIFFSYCFTCRENEVLKVQLKKYVGAVQMLKREGQTTEGKEKMRRKIYTGKAHSIYRSIIIDKKIAVH